jgi:large subunit ribosomal protein L18
MNAAKNLNKKKAQRIGRVRALISGTASRPRLVVQRSNRHFYAQLIDDVKGTTLLSVSNINKKSDATAKMSGKKSDQAATLGESLAKKAVEKGIIQAVFDRRSYQFHGRVKSFVEGAKKGGLKI